MTVIVVMESNKSPKEVALAIRGELSRRGITIADAARMIDRTPQALYNALRGEHRIGVKMATALSNAFGLTMAFVAQGIGPMYNREAKMGTVVTKPSSDNPIHLYKDYDTEGLTPRETKLLEIKNALEKKFFELKPLFEMDGDPIVDIRVDTTRPEDFGFVCQTAKERNLFQVIAYWSGLLRQLIDPGRINEVLNWSPEN